MPLLCRKVPICRACNNTVRGVPYVAGCNYRDGFDELEEYKHFPEIRGRFMVELGCKNAEVCLSFDLLIWGEGGVMAQTQAETHARRGANTKKLRSRFSQAFVFRVGTLRSSTGAA